MPRWTRTRDGRTERWTLDETHDALVETWGDDDGPMRSRTQTVPHDGTRAAIAHRMIAQREAQGFVRSEGVPPPTFALDGFDAEHAASLVRAMRRVERGDAYAYRASIAEAGVAYDDVGRAAWSFAKALPEETARRPGLWALLASEVERGEVTTVCAVVAAVPAGRAFETLVPQGRSVWFTAGAEPSLDALVAWAWRAEGDRVRGASSTWSPAMQTLLAFVQRRFGEPIARPVQTAIRRHAARVHLATGLASHQTIDTDDGPLRLDEPGVVTLMARFDGEGAWWAELLRAARAAKTLSLWRIGPWLGRCVPADLASMLVKCGSWGTDEALAQVLTTLDASTHAPWVWLAAARSIDAQTSHARAVVELCAMRAAVGYASVCEPVPEALDAMFSFAFVSTVYRSSLSLAARAWQALPRERALARARQRLAEPWSWHDGFAVLTAVDDDALLAAYLERDRTSPCLDPMLLAHFGLRALRPLVALWNDTPRAARAMRHRQILHVLAALGDAGAVVDEDCDRFVRFDVEGHDPLDYWDGARASLRRRALRAMPMARRGMVLLRAVTERHAERAVAACEALDDEGVARVVSAYVARRAEGDASAFGEALRSLGVRGVAAMRACRAAWEYDAAWVAAMGASMEPSQRRALLRG